MWHRLKRSRHEQTWGQNEHRRAREAWAEAKRSRHEHRFVIFEWRWVGRAFIATCWRCECGQRRVETT